MILGIAVSLNFSSVQTYLTKRIATFLGTELHANISIGKVYFKPFSTLSLHNLAVTEFNGDTVFFSKNLHAKLDLLKFLDNKITIHSLKLDESYLNYQIYQDSTNLDKYISYFSKPKNQKKTQKNKLQLAIHRIELLNNSFRMVNHKYTKPKKGVNFANLVVSNLSGIIDNIKLDTITTARISKLTLKEKSGLHVKEISASANYSNEEMRFEDLLIRTNNSTLKDYIAFNYSDIKDFSSFLTKVQVTANIKDSYIDSKDIEYFAPTLQTVQFTSNVKKANLSGTVSDIVARNVNMSTGKITHLLGDFTIKGLPNINRTVFGFNIKSLKTSATDIEYFVPKLNKNKKIVLPKQIHNLKQLEYKGSYVGLYNDFIIKGNLSTAAGILTANAQIGIKKLLEYKGKLTTQNFKVGEVLDLNSLDKTSFDLNLDGKGLTLEDLNLAFNGSLNKTAYEKYTYEQINVTGTLIEKNLSIGGTIEDENLRLKYTTSVDFGHKSPNYLLDASIDYAEPKKLGWLQRDSIIIQQAHINTNLTGSTLNTLTGKLQADSIKFSTSKGDFAIENINFSAEGNENNRILSLKSDVLDAHVVGEIDLNTIVPYFKSLAMRYAPAINISTQIYNPQNFNLELNIKSFQPIATLLDPSLTLDDGAHMNAQFSSEDYKAKFIAFSPSVIYRGIKFNNLSVIENADQNAFSLDITSDKVNFADSTYINNVSIRNILANDSLVFNIEMSERSANNYLNLNGNIHFAHNSPAFIHFKPSDIIINNDAWNLNNDAHIQISKGKVFIENLILSQAKQQIKLNGIVSKENEKLNVHFNNFNLTSLNGITKPLGINLQGTLNGEIDITSALKNAVASSNIQTGPIIYNEIPIGQLGLNANFNPTSGNMLIDMKLLDGQQRGVLVNGEYNFYSDDEPLDLKGTLKETDLMIFQPFLRNLVSDLKGKGNATVDIKGTFKNPKITGIGRFNQAEFTVNYLNTHYYLDNQIAMVENNSIILQNFNIRDTKGNKAQANGLINLQKLANPYIDIDVSGNQFMILNTSFKDNSLYYGTAYATGLFRFKGYTSAINIDINAKSDQGTLITLPFNSAMTVTDSDFIYFVSSDSTENKKRIKRNLFNGLTMNMNLNLTPDAEVNLQTSMGSLKGSGNGTIAMKISSLGDFEMFGDYVVSKGKFHFTAQDFINKYFDIKEGGTIRWTGNPAEAVINLNALYQQRTAIGPLYNAAGYAGDNERVLAQADMLIKGTLEQPDVTFDLNFPQNPYIKDQIQSFLSDANNVNQQALSLIVRRSFTPSSTSEIGREVNNTLLSAGTEIAFNQLNNIISQSLNINFLDLNIRSFNDASASLRFWNDRLVISGGITDRTNLEATDLTFFRQGVTTDTELTYKLRKDGGLLFRAYNRPYTRNFLIRSLDAEYISAMGLVYRQEFNSLGEFWRRLWIWNSRAK
ncbi:translocation/assembly module TamB domain-containing protein [Sphingobacterium bovistauri]|uniref:Translocation/assembly module TamB domain-containing protein n=1 Tax=Sphingobacterium bovistauri TaxID=2781959 RepID=A0ABS7Z7P7_9SPHI|nr:translocation/assembly module TamB domain-containing protein [Sphingobacterium bovistauri]MCA5006184.1 translocation/assembly module TamB domain-containing protein [Sphingobacterium bovistauri]